MFSDSLPFNDSFESNDSLFNYSFEFNDSLTVNDSLGYDTFNGPAELNYFDSNTSSHELDAGEYQSIYCLDGSPTRFRRSSE